MMISASWRTVDRRLRAWVLALLAGGLAEVITLVCQDARGRALALTTLHQAVAYATAAIGRK
jgi:hypothetical protein